MEEIERKIKELEERKIALLREQELLTQPMSRGEVIQLITELRTEMTKKISNLVLSEIQSSCGSLSSTAFMPMSAEVEPAEIKFKKMISTRIIDDSKNPPVKASDTVKTAFEQEVEARKSNNLLMPNSVLPTIQPK